MANRVTTLDSTNRLAHLVLNYSIWLRIQENISFFSIQIFIEVAFSTHIGHKDNGNNGIFLDMHSKSKPNMQTNILK